MELDHLAAITISSYDHWWTKQITQEARNTVRKAVKKSEDVRIIALDDDLTQGIMEIYRETPLRRGISFPHNNRSFDDIKRASAIFLEGAGSLGAYHESELIGFVRLVRTQGYPRVMGILANKAHRDKAAMNSLIAKAVEVCAEGEIPFLSYRQTVYGSKGPDSLSKFKQRNGF